ncbi:LolA family protein [Telmatobacter bradus]|uniref:LolA family protein n=1 Tax=Telmatobacter bradus TaxID=474953 RepID=UPI003B4341B2
MKTLPSGGRLKTAAVLLALMLLPGVARLHAQQAASPSVHDVAARVDRHYNQLHSLKAGFSETYAGMGRRRTESGTLLLSKPGRMRWDYSSPAGKLFLLDGKYAWFYTKGQPQAQRIPAKQLDDLRSPLRFLLGHTQLEKELVGLTLASGPGGTFTLTGKPRGQEQRCPRMALTVTAEGTILAIEADENDGSTTRFTFSGEQVNASAPAGAFQFTAPTGVTVIDALPPA